MLPGLLIELEPSLWICLKKKGGEDDQLENYILKKFSCLHYAFHNAFQYFDSCLSLNLSIEMDKYFKKPV